MPQNTNMKLLVVMISTKIPLRICEDMCKTSVEAVKRRSLQTGRGQPTASGLQKWRRPKTADKGFQQLDWGCCHLRKSSPRGSPCCHFGKIKFIKYIAMLFLTFGVDLFLPLGWGCSIYDTNIMYHCGIYSPLTRNC